MMTEKRFHDFIIMKNNENSEEKRRKNIKY